MSSGLDLTPERVEKLIAELTTTWGQEYVSRQGEYEVFLDMDVSKNNELEEMFEDRLTNLQELLKEHYLYDRSENKDMEASYECIEIKERRESKTKGNFHIVLQTSFKLTPEAKLFIAAYLGSDINREVYNFIRVLNKVPSSLCSILFNHNKKKGILDEEAF